MKIVKIRLVLIFGVIGILINSMPVNAQDIIAHRGASYLAPENTIASVNRGFELAGAVEIDIHLTKDNKIVVIHDHTTTRTAPGSNFTINNTISDSLRTLDVGSWKNPTYKGEQIPFLEEVFKVVPNDKTLVIEVKGDTSILPYLKDAVEKSDKKDQFMLISFNKDAVIQWKEIMPQMPVLWLLHSFDQYPLREAIRIAKENNLDGLNVFHQLVTPQFMQTMKGAKLKVYAYTVNKKEIALKLQALKVDGITTDRPQYLQKTLQ
ncbi:MAG TPA: glycerophosphodiester phosphodiesterase family protein [Gillisia sp.]|nr:glycerophosphodiester phosphodiesterase family protein [Gillisia sp.]